MAAGSAAMRYAAEFYLRRQFLQSGTALDYGTSTSDGDGARANSGDAARARVVQKRVTNGSSTGGCRSSNMRRAAADRFSGRSLYSRRRNNIV